MKTRFTEQYWRSDPWFRALCTALASCENENQVADFLRDIGTLSELQAWSERFEVARRLTNDETYRAVAAATGSSTATVTRVARFLEGGEGGYRRHFGRLHQHHRHSRPSGEQSVPKKK